MNMNEYQKLANDVANYKDFEHISNLLYVTLGASESTGKFVARIKEVIANKKGQIGTDERSQLMKDLGNVLWHIPQAATELNVTLDDVALINLQNNLKIDT